MQGVAKTRPAYQDPPPPKLASDAWARKSLTALDVFRIGAWKSVKGLGWLTLNSQETFEVVTREAIEVLRPWIDRPVLQQDEDVFWDEWRDAAASAVGSNFAPKSGLLRLTGVSYPMATAILCVLDSERWPVIDRWAVATVFGHSAFNWQRASVYRTYARHLATVGHKVWGPDLSIHELDQRAMRASMPDGELPTDWRFADIPMV
jgi:hypothetical protein